MSKQQIACSQLPYPCGAQPIQIFRSCQGQRRKLPLLPVHEITPLINDAAIYDKNFPRIITAAVRQPIKLKTKSHPVFS